MKIDVNKGEIVIRCSPTELDALQNHIYGLVDDGTLEPMCTCPWCRIMNVWDVELFAAIQKKAGEINGPTPDLENHIYVPEKYGTGRKSKK